MGDDSNPIMMLIWILPIILFVFYGQRIQLFISSSEIIKLLRVKENYDILLSFYTNKSERSLFTRIFTAIYDTGPRGSSNVNSHPSEGSNELLAADRPYVF